LVMEEEEEQGGQERGEQYGGMHQAFKLSTELMETVAAREIMEAIGDRRR
jgi:hypothetical protein